MCCTSVPSWSTIVIDRRARLIGGPTMTIARGTGQPFEGTIDIVGGTSDVDSATGWAAKSTGAPSSPASSPSAVTKDVMCPQISNDSGLLRSGAHGLAFSAVVGPSGRVAMQAVARAVASPKSSATAYACLTPVHAASAAARREIATPVRPDR